MSYCEDNFSSFWILGVLTFFLFLIIGIQDCCHNNRKNHMYSMFMICTWGLIPLMGLMWLIQTLFIAQDINFGENINQRFTHFLQLLLSWLNHFSLLLDLQNCFLLTYSLYFSPVRTIYDGSQISLFWFTCQAKLECISQEINLTHDEKSNATLFLYWHFFKNIFLMWSFFDHSDIFSGLANTAIFQISLYEAEIA